MTQHTTVGTAPHTAGTTPHVVGTPPHTTHQHHTDATLHTDEKHAAGSRSAFCNWRSKPFWHLFLLSLANGGLLGATIATNSLGSKNENFYPELPLSYEAIIIPGYITYVFGQLLFMYLYIKGDPIGARRWMLYVPLIIMSSLTMALSAAWVHKNKYLKGRTGTAGQKTPHNLYVAGSVLLAFSVLMYILWCITAYCGFLGSRGPNMGYRTKRRSVV